MSRSWFKQLMNSITGNTYYYFDRSLYVLNSGLLLTFVAINFDPLSDFILFEGFNSNIAFYMTLVVLLLGAYFFV